MEQSKSAGQSIVGLQQQLSNFKERWDKLTQTIEDKRKLIEDSDRKKVFLEDAQKVLLKITEITTYVETVIVEMKNNPKELLTMLEVSPFIFHFIFHFHLTNFFFSLINFDNFTN